MNISSISFGSRYKIQGKNIDMENPDHMYALSGATGIAKNGKDLFEQMYFNDDLNKENFIFNVPDSKDKEFESLFKIAVLKFKKIN